MQTVAIQGLTNTAGSILEFAERISFATQHPQDLDRLSPIIMDSIYMAAANYAWLIRESGNENYQKALETLRLYLKRFSSRWRNAAEYLRILEAKEFSSAVGASC
jgi:hypothetical protein